MPSVLIVDDEPLVCEFLSYRYKKEGFETLTAANGKEALNICQNSTPDVVITDMKMPILDGIEFINDLKNMDNYYPIIVFMSGYSEMSLEEAYAMGVDALFNKPFNVGDILGATKKFLKNKELYSDINSIKDNEIFHSEQMAMLSELSAGIIHNINNHIAFISTSSFILKKYLEEDLTTNPNNELKIKALNISDKIYKYSGIISKIIKSIKTLAYPNNRNLKKENANLFFILENSMYLLEDYIKLNNIKCFITCDKDIEIPCFPEYLIQVFINIIKNSFEALDEKESEDKWIKIDVIKEENNIQISFTDSGNGIKKEIIPFLMKPFQTTKNRDKGIGVGLSICKKLMELHEGTIEYDDNSENTRFVLNFKI
ncbi:hybrid sensor histidine kinase/response regulator [Silvanigrella aquatica]|uniref:histidine kinase n=1 Tax=Silvanigrella aquatica TaxID=1915309 RepID=A0A1L4CY53_9BACT|nr:hybrid sensor histidine kinase/response regulator [Silvanigrella aquatica]APJ02878.1 hypothetical protein AXG55_02655 [Silvanigrella aquatica]